MIGFGQRVAEQAELWVDTPFVWGQSVRGRGCDCKGLIAGVARELGRPEGESVAALTQGYGAGRFVPGQLLAGLAGLFDRACEAEEGDIAVILIKGLPQHLAVVTCAVDGRPVRMVEAYLGLGRVRPVIVGDGHSFHSFWRWRDESVSSSSAAGGPE